MEDHNQPLEIHIHGTVLIRTDVAPQEVQAVLEPLVAYAKRHHALQGKSSLYEEEPGIEFNPAEQSLSFCWSVPGDIDFREMLEELVMGLNDISRQGAALEISVYDLECQDDDWEEADMAEDAAEDAPADDSRDDFFVLFVGPTPAAIMQVQRDLLVRDVTALMERHFEQEEMLPVVKAIDQMWEIRYNELASSIKLSNLSGTHNAIGSGGSNGLHRLANHANNRKSWQS